MKETGLMFKAPLVRSILDGSKTQTRRLVKPQPVAGQGMVNAAYCGDRNLWLRDGPCDKTDPAKEWRCPMGQPGDRIYVRETWNWFDPQEIPAARIGPRAPFTGIAGGERPIPWVAAFAADGPLPYPGYDGRDHWRPSIHMPKWAARIWLDITSVRVERLQDISEADALAEGIVGVPSHPDGGFPLCTGYMSGPDDGKTTLETTAAKAFARLWESTGGDWAANPWCWVIDFKRDQAQGGK